MKRDRFTVWCKKRICSVFPKASPKLRRKINSYRRFLIYGQKEYEKETDFLRKNMPRLKNPNAVPLIPYEWIEEYTENENINKLCRKDTGTKSFYLEHKGKRLYFPQTFGGKEAVNAYKQLLIEQDSRSPHKYYSETCNMEDADVFVDVGCAEAIMSLEAVNQAETIIVVEGMQVWFDALKNTFRPYKNVDFIFKFAGGNGSDDSFISLDAILHPYMEQGKRILIKMDVEGSEMSVLNGARKALSYSGSRWICAAYHKYGDFERISGLFRKHGYSIEKSDHYMFRYNPEQGDYFFTPGIIRAWKE